jgi:chemotaxis protein MotA
MFIIIGAVVVIGGIVAGYTWEGGKLGALVQPAELVIIGGAAAGSTLIATPVKVISAMIS